MRSGGKRDLGLTLIAVFKLTKALILLAAGIGAAMLLHNGVQATLEHWVRTLWVGRESRLVQELIDKVSSVDVKKLKLAEEGTFVYAALLFTEGTGLLLRQHWAEYLTIIITASFIPFEIYVMMRRFSFERMMILIVNIAVVIYLVRKVRRDRRAK
jgi:uncharacterized membrane protein (DUF2068 family)